MGIGFDALFMPIWRVLSAAQNKSRTLCTTPPRHYSCIACSSTATLGWYQPRLDFDSSTLCVNPRGTTTVKPISHCLDYWRGFFLQRVLPASSAVDEHLPKAFCLVSHAINAARAERSQLVPHDRAGVYAESITRGAPQAIQVADRRHLLKNLRNAIERAPGCCQQHIPGTACAANRSASSTTGVDAPGRKSPQHDEHDCGSRTHSGHRQPMCKKVTEKNDRHVREHHA